MCVRRVLFVFAYNTESDSQPLIGEHPNRLGCSGEGLGSWVGSSLLFGAVLIIVLNDMCYVWVSSRSPWTSRETDAASKTRDRAIVVHDYHTTILPCPHREQSSRIRVRTPTTSCIVC